MARREDKKRETREALIRAAREVFWTRGYDQATVDEIVAMAGVSQRTFFRYFASKIDVALPHRDEREEQLRSLLERHRNIDSPILGMRNALLEFAQDYQGYKDALYRDWQLVMASPSLVARDAELDRRTEEIIAEELDKCGVAASDARLLAGVIFGGIRANLHTWYTGGCRQDLTEMGNDLMDLLAALDAWLAARHSGTEADAD